MKTETKHTPFMEAIMRAYSAGWTDGGFLEKHNDDGKHATAIQLANDFPNENAAPDLLEALEKTFQWLETSLSHDKIYVDPVVQNTIRAAIAKARGE